MDLLPAVQCCKCQNTLFVLNQVESGSRPLLARVLRYLKTSVFRSIPCQPQETGNLGNLCCNLKMRAGPRFQSWGHQSVTFSAPPCYCTAPSLLCAQPLSSPRTRNASHYSHVLLARDADHRVQCCQSPYLVQFSQYFPGVYGQTGFRFHHV